MIKEDKGAFDCRCECCVYWRRHVHRVAANADRRTKDADGGRKFERAQHKYYLNKCRELWGKERELKKENALLRSDLKNAQECIIRQQNPTLWDKIKGLVV